MSFRIFDDCGTLFETKYINVAFLLLPENKLWIEFKITEEEPLDLEILEFLMLDG